ncbi:unnamed protein product [Trichobilharzia szidati]|nr:unnamed protein product [Trichobilharzia szidati]
MKRAGKSNDTDPPPKISKTNNTLFSEGEIDSWQASLGCSLAERLEKISTMQNLTTRQVKRLLKDVLTNEDVVSALRRYIDGEFKEPETGEISAATRRRAKSLGLFCILSELGEMSNHNLQSRAVTRSLTRRVEESLPDHLSHSISTNTFVANVCSEETGNHDPTASFQLEKTAEQSLPNHSLSFLDEKENEEGEADAVEERSTDKNATNKSVDAGDPDDDVYAQFLRSLFASPCNSSNCTPNKSNSRITTPIKSSAICENLLRDDSNGVEPLSSDKRHSGFQNTKTLSLSSQSPSGRNINVDEDEDPDDPEFDVMAELDEVNGEDFFYELRDDRAVRVSKVETKNLHADLRALFNSGEEREDCTYKSRRPSVLAMNAYRQRLFQMNRTTPNQKFSQTEKFDMTHYFQSSMPCTTSSANVNKSVVSIPRRKRIALTNTELVRLERQLGMHIQLLTTSFLLTYDFPDMHESTTRPCASLLKTLVAKRQAFDLVALQKKVSGAIHSVTSFYWRCPTLDMAIDLISDYSGLSMLPRLPWNPYKQGVGHILTKSQSFAFPIPYCLLDIMINSPIWSYAYLMPTVLGPHPKGHVRLVFHPSEDALMVMGLADFSGALSRCRRILESKMSSQRCFSRNLKSKNKQPGRYIAYRLIGRYILPHRTFLQLRSRRWNLLANRDSIDNAGDSRPVSVATRYLLQLYKELSQPGEVDLKRIQQYANEMSSLAIPHGIPLITSCLSDRNPQELFTFEGLPTEVGYEDVLSYNNCGESIKRKLDVLTEFTQNANCFWKSQTEKASRSKETETNYLSVLDDESMIKLEQNIQCDVLGPNYLPAIPVDLNPDGTVVLSRTSEPGLVEVTEVTDEPGSISNEKSTNLPSSEIRHGRVCQRITSHHIEFILARINKRKSDGYTNKNEARSVADCDILNGVVTSGVSDFIQGEQQFNEISNVFESYYNNTGNVALDACQKVADSLVNTFHLGFDRFSGDYGDTCFSPKKFNHILKSPYIFNAANTTSYLSPGCPSHVQPIPDSLVCISDECQSQQAGVFPSACFVSSSRFIARCRARGDATSADLLTLPSSVIGQSQTLVDEMDVRRARSLLDRCRTYLAPADYRCMMRGLMNLNQAVHYPTSAGSNHDQQSSRNEVLVSLACVLNCLKNHVPLWEDFVRFLTPSQARSLGLLSTYLNLARIGRVQRVLQDIVPQDRRFWRRLRNLADSCSIKARYMPVKKKVYVGSNGAPAESSNTSENPSGCSERLSDGTQTTHKSSMTEQCPVVDSNQPKSPRFRSVQLKGGDMHDSFAKAWSVLERSWRSRPVLLSCIASVINTRHKPCSGFEQSFEETDVLARNPVGIPNASDELNQSASVCNVDEYTHGLEADTNDPVNNLSPHLQSLFSDGWEICTDLSSAAYNRNNPLGTAWARRQCPCLCHLNASPNKTAGIMNQSGKPAKVDCLGLRHCISCSLRVHRGTLYIDECNLHLRHVQITWPLGFKPKTRLPTSIPSSDALSTQNNRLTTMQHTSSISTRVAVNELAKVHSKSYSSNILSNHCTRLPDMAGRRVSVEYVHTRKSTTSINHEIIPSNNHGYGDTLGAVEIQSPCDLTDLNLRSFLEHNESDSIPQDPRSKFGYLENPISWTLDDEAACFNTEAFASVSDENHECEFRVFSNSDMDDWTPEEDRQLLEFCKTREHYSSKMFSILAEIWEPKPYDFCPQRSADELEARFKQLMRATLKETYDPELFQTPCTRNSSTDSGE